MIGLDTNVLIRYLTQDDPQQSALANKLFQETLSATQQGFISLVVLAEVCWVLQSNYQVSDAELNALVVNLLQTPQLEVEKRDCVNLALNAITTARGRVAGLIDYIINAIAMAEGCEYCVTFDKRAGRSAGMKLLDSTLLA